MLTKAVRGAIINFAKALLLQTSSYGGVAHLVERLLRMQEVRGSIPLISTIEESRRYRLKAVSTRFSFCLFISPCAARVQPLKNIVRWPVLAFEGLGGCTGR